MTTIARALIRLALNMIWVISGAGAVLLASIVVLGFLILHLCFRVLWWLFNLPARLMEGQWSKS